MRKPFCCLAPLLVLLFAINGGFVGAFNINLVESAFGSFPLLVRVIYILVGLSGILGLISFAKAGGRCAACAGKSIP